VLLWVDLEQEPINTGTGGFRDRWTDVTIFMRIMLLSLKTECLKYTYTECLVSRFHVEFGWLFTHNKMSKDGFQYIIFSIFSQHFFFT